MDINCRLFFTYAKAYESSQGLMRIFSLASPDLSSTGSLDLTVYHSSNMLEVPRTTNLDGIDLLDSFLSHLFRRKYLLKEKCLITGYKGCFGNRIKLFSKPIIPSPITLARLSSNRGCQPSTQFLVWFGQELPKYLYVWHISLFYRHLACDPHP